MNKVIYAFMLMIIVSLLSLFVMDRNKTSITNHLNDTHIWRVSCEVDDQIHIYEYISSNRESTTFEKDFCWWQTRI